MYVVQYMVLSIFLEASVISLTIIVLVQFLVHVNMVFNCCVRVKSHGWYILN